MTLKESLIDPWHMRKGYGYRSRSVYVCIVCVCACLLSR